MAATTNCFRLIESILQEECHKNGSLLTLNQNRLVDAFYKSRSFTKAEKVFASEPEIDRLHLRHYRDHSNTARQGNMIILKNNIPATGEKGVLVVKYSPAFEHLPAVFNIKSLLKEYRVVFEPSSYRNIESALFLYSGCDQPHVFQAAQHDDKVLLDKLSSSIRTIDLGSGDWTDFQTFSPIVCDKVYDVVMVASWLKLKRHEVLFQALRKLKDRGKSVRVALIGYPVDMQKQNIIDKSVKYGVDSFCDLYENLPQSEVARIVSSSKVALHLSKAEGTNKASYEAMMCNVPLIVYKDNVGFRNDYINEKTGMLSGDITLADTIEYVLAHQSSFSPREWILKHSGYANATYKLNEILKAIAQEMNEPWTVDIVGKKNGPNFSYVSEADRIHMEPAYASLRKHLILNSLS